MTAPVIRWNYEELAQIAQIFDAEADRARSMQADVRRQIDILRSGHWIGVAADKFYAQSDAELMPALTRLNNALANAAQTTRQISEHARETEERAATLLGRLRAMADLMNQFSPGLGAALAGAIAAAAAHRAAALANPSSAFNIMGTELISASEAPASVQIPSSLSTGMKGAWDDSFPDGKSHEQGGILVRKADGTYEFRRGSSDNGTSGTFSVNRGDLKAGETLVASAHTHPYDASEGSHTNVPFSGTDIANLIFNPEPMKMVQSGEGQFVVARSKEFDALFTGKSDADKEVLYGQMKADWDAAFDAAPGTFAQRNDAAVKAVASKYHLLYYSGKGDTLNR